MSDTCRWSRRELLARGCALLALLPACVEDTDKDGDSGLLDSSAPDDTDVSGTPWCDPVAGDAADGWIELSFADHPELAEIGGGKLLTVGGERMNVAHVAEGCAVAMGVVCTHNGCTVEYRPSGLKFVCPCHGALYNYLGVPIAGPAPNPLPTWPAAVTEDAIWVQV